MKRTNNRRALIPSPRGEGRAALPFRLTAKLFSILFLALTLCGCGQESEVPETTPEETAPSIVATFPAGLYAPSQTESRTQGAVRAYPLGLGDARDLKAWGGGLLVFSGEENTELTLLTGDNLAVTASVRLNFPLSHQDPSLQLWERELAFFDSQTRETVVLDNSLTPVTRIAAPESLSGLPLLSEDRNTLYYCTPRALMAWDQETGIHRKVKEMAYPGQSVAGLHQKDTIVECSTEEGRLFLTADTGRLDRQWDSSLTLQSRGQQFFAAFPLGFENALVFGTGEEARILLPHVAGAPFFLPQSNALVIGWQAGTQEIKLDYYSLETGLRESQLTLETGAFPTAITGADEIVSILVEDAAFSCDTIYRWDVSQMSLKDEKVYTSPYHIAPQSGELAQCQAYADAIGAKHGITVLIGKDAVKAQPWDYHLEAETQPAIILRELQLLEQRLSLFPEGMLSASAEDFTALKLCLVRSVTGSAESGSISRATGVQFLEGTDSHVAIATGRFAQQALYHELFHILETHILVNSTALDRWEELNPTGFQYDYSYITNATRDSGIYLQGDQRSFIDTYSMSFPKEDRARVFEYAMLVGCAELFQTEPMQGKLAAICQGLREAYGLKEVPERFQWEQYLKN